MTTRTDKMTLNVSFKNYQRLAHKRATSLRRGVLVIDDDGDWVPATLTYNNESYRVNIRLKGDTPTHWAHPENWSFKVKTKTGRVMNGMRRFALQLPAQRNYLNEFVFHQLLKYNDLISLRYEFVELSVNGEKRPIYALEQNFDKHLIEGNQRREGVLFRFDTSPYWRKFRWPP